MTDCVCLLTFNVLTFDSASGQERHQVVRRLLPDLRPDVAALQEVTRRPDFDQAAELLGPEFAIVDLHDVSLRRCAARTSARSSHGLHLAGNLMDALPRVITRPSDPRSA